MYGKDQQRQRRADQAVAGRGTEEMPEFPILEGTVLSARQWQMLSLQRRTAWTMIGLAAVVHLLRDRRLYAQVILRIIELAAISQVARKELAATFKGMMKWDNERLAKYAEELHQREAKAGRAGLPGHDLPARRAPDSQGIS